MFKEVYKEANSKISIKPSLIEDTKSKIRQQLEDTSDSRVFFSRYVFIAATICITAIMVFTLIIPKGTEYIGMVKGFLNPSGSVNSEEVKVVGMGSEENNPLSDFSSDSPKEAISDIANWKHPAKPIFDENFIKINKVELLNNKVTPIFYVEFTWIHELTACTVDYFDDLIKKIASANDYWNFKIIDDKNKLTFTVVSDNKNRTVTDIYVNGKKDALKELINEKNKVIKYVNQNVPEIKQHEEWYAKNSKLGSTQTIFLEGVPNENADTPFKDYYRVYVGEDVPETDPGTGHSVRWETFCVDKEFSKIMVYDVFKDELITLEQWRESEEAKY